MKRLFIWGAMLALLVVGKDSFAQSVIVPQYNPNSVTPIPEYEQLYRVAVWRKIDLKEKQNKGFFAKNSEISKIIIDGVRSGEISHIYETDSLTTEITKDEFLARLRRFGEDIATDYLAWESTESFYEGEIVTYNGVDYFCLQDNENKPPDQNAEIWRIEVAEQDIYFNSDVSIMELREDIIFDKRRARVYYDIQSIKLFVNSEAAAEGFNKVLGVFSYKELEDFFRRRPDICIWYNQYNSAENKNLADAFLLRMFDGILIKVENPDDELISQIYQEHSRAHLFAADWLEMQLMEKEHNLWSY
jgi:gliding motility associated protien GldN